LSVDAPTKRRVAVTWIPQYNSTDALSTILISDGQTCRVPPPARTPGCPTHRGLRIVPQIPYGWIRFHAVIF
jgi:hypothetical protein